MITVTITTATQAYDATFTKVGDFYDQMEQGKLIQWVQHGEVAGVPYHAIIHFIVRDLGAIPTRVEKAAERGFRGVAGVVAKALS